MASETWLSRSNVEFFESRLRAHAKVAAVNREERRVYVIERHSQAPVKVFLTNSYVIGLAEYYDVRGRVPDLDAIVTISPYNSVSKDAWEAGQSDGVGVFQFREFYGALNYEGDRFVKYVPRDSRFGDR
jgi:hypothetical protein